MHLVDLIEDPRQLAQAIDARRKELGIIHRDLDELAGWADGYSSKLACGMKTLGGMSLPTVLKALGLRLALVADNEWLPPVTLSAMERGVSAATILGRARALPSPATVDALPVVAAE
jgi:hypothetical protein